MVTREIGRHRVSAGCAGLVGRVRPVLTVVPGAADAGDPHGGGSALIDELVREGARRMLAEALQAEVDDYIARFTAERDENGRRLVVRNCWRRMLFNLTPT